MKKVAAVECQSYKTEEVYLAVKEGIERIGFVIPEGTTVLIKPNVMSQNKPEQHTITHYAIIDALCWILKEKKCQIIIGESISFYEKGLTRKAFITSGIKGVADKYDARLVAFEEEPLVKIEQNLVGINELYVPKILFEVDWVINACKLKTHSGMRLSGAIKNMFGCLPGGYKQKIHQWTGNEFELGDVILDVHSIVKPALSIMDAVISLDGGPTALGRPTQTSRIFASTNPGAIDLVAGKMIGYKPEEVPILIQARNRGMIENFNDVEILGDIEPVPFKKLVKKDLDRISNKNSIFVRNTYVDIRIKNSRCKTCEKCIVSCPAKAIRAENNRIVLDRSVCINCYYCLFICRKKAIRIKSSPMNKVIRMVRRIAKI